MKNKFWKSKRVLVTGSTGFKGSWLCLWLQALGAKVFGVALDPPTNPSLFKIANVNNGMKQITADVRDLKALEKIFDDCLPEIIIHLAAQPLVRESYLKPIETYSVNIMGTVNLFEAAKKCKSVKAILNVTTDKCYENREWIWSYRENEPMGGYDPYSSSKGCVELISSAYRNSYFSNMGIALATARAGNVIGGGDWAKDRLIPDIINSFINKKTVKIRNPNSIRPWQHVLEPLYGYLILCEKLYNDGETFSEAWNFGPVESDQKTVGWIVDYIGRLWGEKTDWEVVKEKKLHEANYLKLDISKSLHKLEWSPCWSIEKALDEIMYWYKSMLENKNMNEVCLEQINNYYKDNG